MANRDTWKVLTKIHLSKSIQFTRNTDTDLDIHLTLALKIQMSVVF